MPQRREILRMARQVLRKEMFRKLKGVEDKDFMHAAKYVIVSSFEEEHRHLAKELKRVEKGYHDLSHARMRLMMVPGKIKIFSETLNEEDFNKVMHLFSHIKREIDSAEQV
jgi:hypothetical protein